MVTVHNLVTLTYWNHWTDQIVVTMQKVMVPNISYLQAGMLDALKGSMDTLKDTLKASLPVLLAVLAMACIACSLLWVPFSGIVLLAGGASVLGAVALSWGVGLAGVAVGSVLFHWSAEI